MFKVIIPVDEKTARIEYFETPNYVTLQTNGVIIMTDDPKIADGVLSEDSSVIYAFKGGKLDTETYNYEACYMYEVSGNEYIRYTKGNINTVGTQVTETQVALTGVFEEQVSTSSQVTEAQTALVDVFEGQQTNASQITEVQMALTDVFEMIASMNEPTA